MKLAGKVVVITGAASGIGAALARRFVEQGVRALVLGDVQEAPLRSLADELNRIGTNAGAGASAGIGAGTTNSFTAIAQRCDVTQEADIKALSTIAEQQFGRIDLFCSNAGLIRDGHEQTSDADWQLNWNVHVMAHVWAARAVLPGMIARGEGYLFATASAAGLLTSLPSSSYAVTKHAAIAFAESMAIRHAKDGIKVSVLCPQAVDTPMIQARGGGERAASRVDGVMPVAALADCVVAGLEAEHFLILPHPEVLTYFQRKANDYDRWLAGMRRLDEKLRSG